MEEVTEEMAEASIGRVKGLTYVNVEDDRSDVIFVCLSGTYNAMRKVEAILNKNDFEVSRFSSPEDHIDRVLEVEK